MARIHDGVLDSIACGGEHCPGEHLVGCGGAILVKVPDCSVHHGHAKGKSEMAESQAPLVAGGVAGLRGDESGNPVGFLRGGVVCNVLSNHGLEGFRMFQGQGVCHKAVGENRDELDID